MASAFLYPHNVDVRCKGISKKTKQKFQKF